MPSRTELRSRRVSLVMNTIMHTCNIHHTPASAPPHLHLHLMCTSYLVKGRPFSPCRPRIITEHCQAARCSQQANSERACAPLHCSSCSARRAVLLAVPLSWLTWQTSAAQAITGTEPATIRLDLAPDQSKYNAADERLRDAAARLQLALNAEDVKVIC